MAHKRNGDRPIVFVLNRAGHDYSPAEHYGDLVYCTEGFQNRFEANQLYRVLAELMDDSEPRDYILVSGLSILCLLAGAVFGRKHGRVNLLLFRSEGNYAERTVYLDNLLTEIAVFDPEGEANHASQ